MRIDTHVRVAAWLHIALGAIWIALLALFALFVGGLSAVVGAATQGSDHGVLAWMAGLGVVVFLFIIAFPLLEVLGGVLLLGGGTAGRVITIIFSVVELINFPFGTAVGVYSLWALMRELPPQAPVATQPGVPQPY